MTTVSSITHGPLYFVASGQLKEYVRTHIYSGKEETDLAKMRVEVWNPYSDTWESPFWWNLTSNELSVSFEFLYRTCPSGSHTQVARYLEMQFFLNEGFSYQDKKNICQMNEQDWRDTYDHKDRSAHVEPPYPEEEMIKILKNYWEK